LIDALAGHHLWSERYDRGLKDFFALQDEITIHILNAMKAELTIGPMERQYAKVKTNNLKAYEKNYQGVGFFYKRTKPDNETARRLFEEALALDPKYYWPQVMLGYTYFSDARFGWSENPAQSIQQARECAQKALALDDSLDPGHSLVAAIYLVMRQYDKAVGEAKRAVDLNPNGAYPISVLAAVLGAAGQWEQSILYEKQSMRLNPIQDPWNYYLLGRAQFMTGKSEESITTLQKAIKMNPNYLFAHILLAANYGSSGRAGEAAAAAKEILRINPHFTLAAHAKTLFYKNKADIEREVAALRRAGLK
jgi:adenylate cyclase